MNLYPKNILLFLISIILVASFSSFSQNTYSMHFEVCGTSQGGWIEHGDVLDMNSSFSVGGWAYVESDQHLTILSKQECCGYNGYQLSINDNDDELLFQLETGSGVVKVTTPFYFL